MAGASHAALEPSPWVTRWAHVIAAGARVLDLASGHGRHARWFARSGCAVSAVDRDPAALAGLRGVERIELIQADLEHGPWPFTDVSFDAIVVTNYLHRPLFPLLVRSLSPGGVLIYETFMLGNEAHGRPSNPAFLLRPSELLEAFGASLTPVAFEQGIIDAPKPAVVQRYCGVRGAIDRVRLTPA